MNKKILILTTIILCLTFVQNTAFAGNQQKRPFRRTPIDYTSYAWALQDKIITNWNPKTIKRQKNTVVSIKIDKNGTIKNIIVQKSSKNKKFDNEVTDSIMRSVPFDSLPENNKLDYKNFQLSFIYDKTQDKTTPIKYIIANVNNQEGYDEYIEQVDKIIAEKLNEKSYFFKKDTLLTMKINKDGKLIYVKVKNPPQKEGFIRKEFNRKTLLTLQNTSFPPIPDKMGANDITIDYRVLTQRQRLFRNFIFDYLLNFLRTGTESYCVQNTSDI